MFQVKHKLDAREYALKKISLHLEFVDDAEVNHRTLLSHPAMKEIEAISKLLSHKNIVGYKCCWVEAENPNMERIKKIVDKQNRRRKLKGQAGANVREMTVNDGIDETNDDDSSFEMQQ